MSSDSFGLFFLIVVLVLVVLALAWHYSRSASLLQKWADENGYQILHKEYRYLRRGPFFWTTSRDQAVY